MDTIAHRAAARTPTTRTAPIRRALYGSLAALGLGLLPALSAAQSYYPRIVGSAEDHTVEYGPGPDGNIVGGNIVGGGHVMMHGGGEETTLTLPDPRFGQPPRAGMVPVVNGSGESPTTIWVPADIDPLRQALVGGDGSLPEAASSRTSVRNASRTAGPRG